MLRTPSPFVPATLLLAALSQFILTGENPAPTPEDRLTTLERRVAELENRLAPQAKAAAAAADHPVNLIVVRLDGDRRRIEATRGDLIQISADFDFALEDVLYGMKVDVEGDAVQKVAVVRGPKETDDGSPIVGLFNVSAFLVVKQEGESLVTITPRVAPGTAKKPATTFRVVVRGPFRGQNFF